MKRRTPWPYLYAIGLGLMGLLSALKGCRA